MGTDSLSWPNFVGPLVQQSIKEETCKGKSKKTNETHVVDEHGEQLTIDEQTTFTLSKPVSGPANWVKGSRSYKLNGEHCNQVDVDIWKTLHSERILRRI